VVIDVVVENVLIVKTFLVLHVLFQPRQNVLQLKRSDTLVVIDVVADKQLIVKVLHHLVQLVLSHVQCQQHIVSQASSQDSQVVMDVVVEYVFIVTMNPVLHVHNLIQFVNSLNNYMLIILVIDVHVELQHVKNEWKYLVILPKIQLILVKIALQVLQ